MPATVPEAGKGAEKLPAAIPPGLRIYSQTVRKRIRRSRVTVQTGLRIYCADRTKTYRKEASGPSRSDWNGWMPLLFCRRLNSNGAGGKPWKRTKKYLTNFPPGGNIPPVRRRGLKKTASPLLLSGFSCRNSPAPFGGSHTGIAGFLCRGWIRGAASFVINLNGR